MENGQNQAPERIEEDNIYKAAFLMARGCRLLGKHIENGRKMIFELEGLELGKLITNRESGKAIVNYDDFVSRIISLKGMVAEFLKSKREGKEK
jgi:hypothetical protein